MNIDLDKCPMYIKVIQRSLKQKVDMIELHFKYSLEGKGFEEAKSHFIKQIITK
jgi:hypothetical protein